VSASALFVLDTQRVIRFSKRYLDPLHLGVDKPFITLEAFAYGSRCAGAFTSGIVTPARPSSDGAAPARGVA
jgi:hypothetical protein